MWVTGQSRRDAFDGSNEGVDLLPWTPDDKINADPYHDVIETCSKRQKKEN